MLAATVPAAADDTETDLSGAELDALLGRLVAGETPEDRASALSALLEAQPGILVDVTERLFAAERYDADLLGRVVTDYVRAMPPELPVGSPVPPRTALAPLLHQLVTSPHPAYDECWRGTLRAAALIAMLDVMDTTESLMEAIRSVSLYDGAWNRIVRLVIHGKGDRALPALLLSRRAQERAVKEFIPAQLARMGKERAPLMAQVNDDQLLAEILHAIGEVRDSEGVNVMLSFINSDRPFVRAAAREALRKYERNAIWPVRQAYADFVGETADTRWGWEETMDRLFAAQDRARLEPYDVLLTEGLAAAADGRFAEMEEVFGAVLGREPEYPRRAEMVPGLLAYGEKLLADGDVLQARRVLRMASYLVPAGHPQGARIRAHLDYLEGLRRRDLGFPDPDPFRRAAAADPAYARLIAERGILETLGAPAAEGGTADAAGGGAPAAADRQPGSDGRATRLALAAGVVLAALGGLLFLVARGRTPGRILPRTGAPTSTPAAVEPASRAAAPSAPEPAAASGPATPEGPAVDTAAAAPDVPADPTGPDAGGGSDGDPGGSATAAESAGREASAAVPGDVPAATPAHGSADRAPAPPASAVPAPVPAPRPGYDVPEGPNPFLEPEPSPEGQGQAPPAPADEPYRRIEAALRRIRTDVPPEPDPPDGAGGEQE
jgi:hypothetical protein